MYINHIAGRNDYSHQPCSLAHGCRLSHTILCHTISVNCSRLIRCWGLSFASPAMISTQEMRYSATRYRSINMTYLLIIELDDGKIYRNPLYLMVKTIVSCRFPLKPIVSGSCTANGQNRTSWLCDRCLNLNAWSRALVAPIESPNNRLLDGYAPGH